ncbi:ABC transporter substrate-binding protein [Pseudorhodoferax soli]|uniref:Amino acid/amide ABC transporter substrate-binding protein (HAAT family) n=1 Tax=Pseudorhodoferax soli TaxID=545864 RepID=A0A368XYC7_9BURK|nr:ABC transporter substrate-binding protein [Pseudorhodoferax soli]RCW72865.1 amino acid/amide ABC transporter substrate-binding protein (HAAT family) [Pseudorhodoferax soli]
MNASKLIAAALLATAAGTALAQDIKLGFMCPLTGGSAPFGVSARDGASLAVKEINARGGVLGRKLVLAERDTESKNERGVQLAQELIQTEKVAAGIGFCNTGVSLAAQKYFQEARIPVFDPVATGTAVTRQFPAPSYVFRVGPRDELQARMLVDETLRQSKARVAILADSTNYGQLGRADVEKALIAKGMKPVAVEKFNVRDVDMTPQLLKARQAGADIIVAYGIGPELAQIANSMAKLGWKVPLVTSWNSAMSNFIDTAQANGNGVRMPQTFIQEATDQRKQAFIASYARDYQLERIPSPSSAAQAYDAVLLLAAALQQAGSTDGVKVREALEQLRQPVAGVIGTYTRPFDANERDATPAGMIVWGEVRDGRVVYAYAHERSAGNAGSTAASSK